MGNLVGDEWRKKRSIVNTTPFGFIGVPAALGGTLSAPGLIRAPNCQSEQNTGAHVARDNR